MLHLNMTNLYFLQHYFLEYLLNLYYLQFMVIVHNLTKRQTQLGMITEHYQMTDVQFYLTLTLVRYHFAEKGLVPVLSSIIAWFWVVFFI